MDLSGSGWANLLSVMQTAGKTVKLNLSACTISGTEFDPGTANTGKQYITSLVLPDDATSIKVSAFSSNFSSLANVGGDNITTIGSSAFYGCTGVPGAKFVHE